MNLLYFFILTGAFLVVVDVYRVEASRADKVLYKDLGTLNFYQGEKTTNRRTRSVPQLVCLKGCKYPQPKAVQCTNAGWDGTSNLWKCKAHMDPPYVLDRVEIVCEGYKSPDDPFVTVGSCSLEYSVKRNGKSASKIDDEPPVKAVPFVLCVAVLIFLMYKICLKPEEEGVGVGQTGFNDGGGPDGHGSDHGHGRGFGRGPGPGPGPRGPGPGQGPGSGPHMGWNIPGMNQRHRPGPSPANAPSAPDYGFAPGGGSCQGQGNAGSGNEGGGGGGGFWTGLAAGGVLGYLFSGNRNRNNAQSSSFFGGGSSGGMFSSRESEPSYFGSSSTNEGSSGLFGSGSSESSETVTTARYRQR